MEMEMRWGWERGFVYAKSVLEERGHVVVSREEICLCKRENLKGGARYKDMQT